MIGQATYYKITDSNPRLADGTYYGERGSMFCAAPRHIKLGSKIEIKNLKTGKKITVVVRDYGAFRRTDLDLSYRSWGVLGNRQYKTGRLKISWKVVQLPIAKHKIKRRKK